MHPGLGDVGVDGESHSGTCTEIRGALGIGLNSKTSFYASQENFFFNDFYFRFGNIK